jgi:hypothetical protein
MKNLGATWNRMGSERVTQTSVQFSAMEIAFVELREPTPTPRLARGYSEAFDAIGMLYPTRPKTKPCPLLSCTTNVSSWNENAVVLVECEYASAPPTERFSVTNQSARVRSSDPSIRDVYAG